MLSPESRFRAAYQQRSPCPREAQRVSTTRIFRSGYFSPSSSAAIRADWQVVDSPEEKARISASFPDSRMGVRHSTYCSGFTAEVVGMAPARMAS